MIVTTLNEEDPNKIFSFLQTSAQASPHYQSFVETMQCLLDFTVDVAHGPKIWDTFKYIRTLLLLLLYIWHSVPLAIQLMQMRDSQEITEEDEVAICPKNTGQYTKMKAEYTRQIDAMGKMLQATGESIPAVHGTN